MDAEQLTEDEMFHELIISIPNMETFPGVFSIGVSKKECPNFFSLMSKFAKRTKKGKRVYKFDQLSMILELDSVVDDNDSWFITFFEL
jgi:hypothetical protein